MYANYEQIKTAIESFAPFEGNSCKGVMNTPMWEYQVFSYGTLIAVFSLKTGSMVLNARKYSQTTSRLQNIIREAWAGEWLTEVV
jgi:hypothetical protein